MMDANYSPADIRRAIQTNKSALELEGLGLQNQNLALQNKQMKMNQDVQAVNATSTLMKSVSDFVNGILQYQLAQKTLTIQDRQQTLKETQERHSYLLAQATQDKEYAYKEAVLNNQSEIAQLDAAVEIRKAQISADVKKSKYKSESLRDLFGRGRYGRGNPSYA